MGITISPLFKFAFLRAEQDGQRASGMQPLTHSQPCSSQHSDGGGAHLLKNIVKKKKNIFQLKKNLLVSSRRNRGNFYIFEPNLFSFVLF